MYGRPSSFRDAAASMIKDLGEITRHPVATLFFAADDVRVSFDALSSVPLFPKLTYQLRLHQSREEDEGER